jgi:hypothetical protein
VKIEGPFEAEALRILREIPGMTVVPEAAHADRHIDAILHFAGTHADVAVEIKSRANAATAWQLVQLAGARPDVPLLLIAQETTAEARRILDENGIGIIDGLGHAHIELPGLVFHLEGLGRPQRANTEKPPTRLRGKAGVAAEAVLLNTERAWQVRDLADAAQVSAGLAHRVMDRLESEGILNVEGKGPNRVRRVTNPGALLDLWAEEIDDQPRRTFGHLLAQTPQRLINELCTNLRDAGIDYALTGAAAANILVPFVTALPVVEVWVGEAMDPAELNSEARAEPVDNGHNVVFLQTKYDTPLVFREKVQELWVTNRFRLYADLRRDPRRGREQADHLRREVIGF